MNNEFFEMATQNAKAEFGSESVKRYGRLAKGGRATVELTQEEACAVLAAYDYGVLQVSNSDLSALQSLVAKLKDQIWP